MTVTDPGGEPATLHFGDGEFAILRPGGYVLCAVSSRRIPLPSLRYWSTDRQEAYSGPFEYISRMGGPA